ncbi:MAG: flagellar export chaperone FliS [Pseudomonadales bacterium]|nr:flagellar export chaperone FliS [Pseudomonadales bacterium]MDG2079206.1 flagellar export chaperone FliS [Pseudomonadales bacterium]
MNKASAGQQYKQIDAQTGVVDADPHRLIQMLFAGALEQIAIAKGCMQRGEIAGKGKAIGKVIGILGALRGSVNVEAGAPELTDNLTALYEFAMRRVSEANLGNEEAGLDDAMEVLKELQAGWNDIRPEFLAKGELTSV